VVITIMVCPTDQRLNCQDTRRNREREMSMFYEKEENIKWVSGELIVVGGVSDSGSYHMT